MAIKLEAGKKYYYCTCGKSNDGVFVMVHIKALHLLQKSSL